VPGAWEIPSALASLNRSGEFDALIALGAVIRGATPHFDYIASGVANGVASLAATLDIPVIFGVLTTDDLEQALERAGAESANKGWDSALAALEMANLFDQLERMKERSRARGWAVQALYAWETRGEGEDALVPILQELTANLRISPKNRFYAEVLLRIVARQRDEIDAIIQRNLTNWSFSRLSVIDRNILRLGVAELMFVDDVPPRVTIREMIHLAERYGTPDSPRFINGVLDAAMREIESRES
jgi:transcription antitermination protein NusB